MPHEISKLKPPTEGNDIPVPKFTYDTSQYDSYEKEGFEPPQEHERHDYWERRFLSQVDTTKQKIYVRIKTIYRTKALDHESGKFKEYIYWDSEWYGKNSFEERIKVIEHFEGKHWEQTKNVVRGFDPQTGRPTAHYEKGQPREAYTIPFSKTNVEKVLKNEHPFGEDSENITDPDRILFYAKIPQQRETAAFRCSGYTVEQFLTPEWKHFVELACQKGGPSGFLQKSTNEHYK